MTTLLHELNHCTPEQFCTQLDGVYERSPWIVQGAVSLRPFASVTALKRALQNTVSDASAVQKLGLIRAHPELAGKAVIAQQLTPESAAEQAGVGLDQCTEEEFARLQQLNADYNSKFGFPFILAVRGPDGKGLRRDVIIDLFARRLRKPPTEEMQECLRQIDRIAELRLNALFGIVPHFGNQILERAEILAAWSEEDNALTCTYLSAAHQRTAAQLARWMRDAGMQVKVDAVGNVVGRYLSDRPSAKTLITGSHFDTVRNGGKYDGREGILLPIAIVAYLHERGERLPFDLEVIAFSEEEGVRFKSSFLASSAIAGQFDMSSLDRTDSNGISLRSALTEAGFDCAAIADMARDASQLLGYIEVHIEQGPVLLQRGLPVGIVTSIAGSYRYQVDLRGTASHAGTTPMTMRRDAAAAAAEIILYVERRCSQADSLVGTVGQLQVPNGSVNVIPGACQLSLDIRAADDATRDAAVTDVLNQINVICAARGIDSVVTQTLSAAAAPCAPWLMSQLQAATERHDVPAFHLPSGAGHDAMLMARITDVAMLFTRCGNGGISHNPLETMTADDAELSAQIFLDLLRNFVVSADGKLVGANGAEPLAFTSQT